MKNDRSQGNGVRRVFAWAGLDNGRDVLKWRHGVGSAGHFVRRAGAAAPITKDGETPYVSHVFRVVLIPRDLFGFEDEPVLTETAATGTLSDEFN